MFFFTVTVILNSGVSDGRCTNMRFPPPPSKHDSVNALLNSVINSENILFAIIRNAAPDVRRIKKKSASSRVVNVNTN